MIYTNSKTTHQEMIYYIITNKIYLYSILLKMHLIPGGFEGLGQ